MLSPTASTSSNVVGASAAAADAAGELQLRSTLRELQAQLEAAQRRMQHVFAQGSAVVSLLSERERALDARLAQHRLKRDEIAASLADRVRLNVGGRVFETTERVLRRYPGSVFDLLLSGEFPVDRDDSGAIFIDRDPDVFEQVLRFLRTGVVPAVFLSEYDAERSNGGGAAATITTGLGQLQAAPGDASGSKNGGNSNTAASIVNSEVLPSAEGDLADPQQLHLQLQAGGAAAVAGAAAAAQQNLHHVAHASHAPASKPMSMWLEYSLQQRHHLLQMEARYFMIDELLLKLSKHRMRWFAAAQRGAPSPRCFATMQIIGGHGYVFGGCSAADHFFDDLFRVALHPDPAQGGGVGGGAGSAHNHHHGDGDEHNENNANAEAEMSPGHDQHVGATSGSVAAAGATSHGGGKGGDDPMLSVYSGPFEWQRVVGRRGQVPEPRSGHTMSIVPTVSSVMMMLQQEEEDMSGPETNMPSLDGNGEHYSVRFPSSNTGGGGGVAGTGVPPASSGLQPPGSLPAVNHGLLILFGNDRTRMLPNAAVFDTDEQAWAPVTQHGTTVPARSGHSLTSVGEFIGNEEASGGGGSGANSTGGSAAAAGIPSSSAAAAVTSSPLRNSSSSTTNGHLLRVPKIKFVLIGGKRIFPDTVHFDDVVVGVYDAAKCSLTWRPLSIVGGNPEPRSYHSSVYRPENGLVYVFGGIISNVYSADLATLNPNTGVWRTVTPQCVPGYSPPTARSGHVAFLVEDQGATKMLVAGSYAEDSEELTVATLTFATMRWQVCKVDPRGQTPSRRAAISGGVLPAMSGGARLPLLVVFAGFELSARRCFSDLYVLPL